MMKKKKTTRIDFHKTFIFINYISLYDIIKYITLRSIFEDNFVQNNNKRNFCHWMIHNYVNISITINKIIV